MTTLMFLLMFGCAKHDKLLTSAKSAFRGNNCLKTLEAYVRSSVCPKMTIVERENAILLRCKKNDDDRGMFYDNYWFRISPAILNIDPTQIPEIEKHTICIDEQHRIEAYPPK